MTEDLVRWYVIAVIRGEDAWQLAYQAEKARLLAEGYRIVSGGCDRDGWCIIDHQTNAVIAEGDGGLIEYSEATDRISDEGPPLCHVDRIAPEDWPDAEVPEGLPTGLAEALHIWTLDHEDEALEWVGGREAVTEWSG